MEKSLNKLLIITGANKGIGFNTVEKLIAAKSDYTILLTSRDKKRGEEAVASLKKSYSSLANNLHYHQLDVTDPDSIKKFVSYLKENKQSVQVLVNNAGVGIQEDFYGTNFVPKEKDIRFIMDTNYHGLVSLTQYILPFLEKDGKVINVSSGLGSLSGQGKAVSQALSSQDWNLDKLNEYVQTFEKAALKNEHTKLGFSQSLYCASKALVNAYTRWVLVPQLKDDQTCFTVHPGWVQTDLGGKNASLKLEDGSVSTLKCINFSLTESKKLNGQFFDYDGKVRSF